MMNTFPNVSFEALSVGDVIRGQDGNKYVVCKKSNIFYWEPYVANITEVVTPPVQVKKNNHAPTPTPVRNTSAPVKKTKEKYYWKNNDKKPIYKYDEKDGDMIDILMPKISPNKFPAGYVWITKFSNISYVVDTEYHGNSNKMTKFWTCQEKCPPCLDAEDYPYEYIHEDTGYCVDYDAQGNKFWTTFYSIDENRFSNFWPHKFPNGHICTFRDGTEWKRITTKNGSSHWKNVNTCDECW